MSIKFSDPKQRKTALTIAGVTAAGIIGATVIANSNRLGVSFDPSKYTSSSMSDADGITFDSVLYSNNSEQSENESVSRENSQAEREDEQTLPDDINNNTAIENSSDNNVISEGFITVGRVSENASAAFSADAVFGEGTGTGTLPVLTQNENASVTAVQVTGDTLAAAAAKVTAGETVPAREPENAEPVSVTAEPSNIDINDKNGNDDNDDNDNSSDMVPSRTEKPNTPEYTAAPVIASPTPSPTSAPTRKPSGGSGSGSSTPQKQSNSNPSNSSDVAPVQKPNTTGGGSTGGSSSGKGDYSGNSVSMYSTGSFLDLCVGQSLESVFSPTFSRTIMLKFDNGAMTLKDDKTTANGFTLHGFSTQTEKEAATATASFTYNAKTYSISIDYSVIQWSLGLHMFDGSVLVSGITPDENLTINLSRYYTAFQRLNPQFCGWRDADGGEIYTTECVMIKPDMQLYPCLKKESPSASDVGEEYEISGCTDVDISSWDTYENCRVLIISDEVESMNITDIAKKFPNLEEVRVSDGNTIYSSVDGVLYEGDTLLFVPPAKTEITEFKEGVAEIGSNAFVNVKAEKITIPDTVTEISEYAFCNAHIGTLEITAQEYSVSGNAFFTDGTEPVAETVVLSTMYVPNFDSETFNFGGAAPVIVVPDSMYDRAYQYYMSTWGVEIERLMGEGSAVKVLTTESGAQNRNKLIEQAVYSFFDSADELTLTSVCPDAEGDFICAEDTVTIAASAFVGCSGITSVVIGEKTTELENGCFNGLTSVCSITFKGAPPKVDDEFFEEMKKDLTSDNLKIYIPAKDYDEYIDEWGEKIDELYGEGSAKKIIEADNDSYEVIDGAQYIRDENGLVLIRVLPTADTDFVPADGTYKIAAGAFETDLNSVTIPDTVTEIEAGTIEGAIGHLFVNSLTKLDLSAIDAKYIFVPISMESEYIEEYPSVMSAAQSYGANSDGIIVSDTALIYVPASYRGELVIGDEIIKIYGGAASGCDEISKITVGSGLCEIGENAFSECRNVQELDMTNAASLSVIDADAFSECVSLGSLSMPASLVSIGNEAFYGCNNIQTVTFAEPQALVSIGDRAFCACNSLTGFNDNDSVKLSSLSSLEILGSEAFALSPLITSADLPTTLEAVPRGLFGDCVNLEAVTDWGSAKIIDEDAFKNTALNTVTFENSSVEEIHSGAFADCDALDTMLIGDNIRYIDTDFAQEGARILLVITGDSPDLEDTDCSALTESERIYGTVYATGANSEKCAQLFENAAIFVSQDGGYTADSEHGDLYAKSESGLQLIKAGTKTIDFDMMTESTITSVNADAFKDCDSITSAVISMTAGELPAYAFSGCDTLESVTFRQKTGSYADLDIGEYAFKDCSSLKDIEFNTHIVNVGNGVFENCTSLEDFYWSSASVSIPDDTFSGCTSLKRIRISANASTGVTDIGDRCFKGCTSLTDIMGFNNVLFATVSNIGESTFENCTSLSELIIPSSVENVGDSAFAGCEGLGAVSVSGEPFTLGRYVFGQDPGESYFYLGETDTETYEKYIEQWQTTLDEDYGEGAVKKLVRATYEPESSTVPEENETSASRSTKTPVTAEPSSSPSPAPQESPKPTEPEQTEQPSPSASEESDSEKTDSKDSAPEESDSEKTDSVDSAPEESESNNSESNEEITDANSDEAKDIEDGQEQADEPHSDGDEEKQEAPVADSSEALLTEREGTSE